MKPMVGITRAALNMAGTASPAPGLQARIGPPLAPPWPVAGSRNKRPDDDRTFSGQSEPHAWRAGARLPQQHTRKREVPDAPAQQNLGINSGGSAL